MLVRTDWSSEEWDNFVIEHNGHPLQSSLWGDARQTVNGIMQYRLAVFDNNTPVWIGRIEQRSVLGLLKIAWIPRGPVLGSESEDILECVFEWMKERGFDLVCTQEIWTIGTPVGPTASQTVVVDLNQDEEALLASVHKEWRYGVRRAEREGVVVEIQDNCEEFYALYKQLAADKGFTAVGSRALIDSLLQEHSGGSSAYLFTASLNSTLLAGAVVIGVGDSLHYFWGAVDRRFSNKRGGEKLQWEIIKWAIENGYNRYDLEGVDAEDNKGTYSFKMRMGGEVVDIPGLRLTPTSILGGVASHLYMLIQRFRR